MKQLFGFNYQRNTTTKEIQCLNSPELNRLDHCVWENILGQSQVTFKTKDIAKLKKMLQMSLTQATTDRAVESF